jgi:geranylgeranyl reductase family protein
MELAVQLDHRMSNVFHDLQKRNLPYDRVCGGELSGRRAGSLNRSFDVVIVGAGPAGSAAALQLGRLGLAARTLLIDARSFPRDKLCGGGLVPESDRLLAHLGVPPQAIPSVPIREVRFEYPGGHAVQRDKQFFRVVHRNVLDDVLAREARARGVEWRDGDAVTRLERDGGRIVITTVSGANLEARVAIGADGASSLVRRTLVGGVRSDRLVALEALTPGHDGAADADSPTAVFDFRPAATGVRGYSWDFPSLRHGEPWMNRGIVAAPRSSAAPLRSLFTDVLLERGVTCDAQQIQGAGASLYDADRPQSAERVLLAGDAVGIDPWFGEGISVALGTGIIAAHTAAEALASCHFAFGDYARRIEQSAVGWSLRRKQAIAGLFYPAARVPGGMAAFLGGGMT